MRQSHLWLESRHQSTDRHLTHRPRAGRLRWALALGACLVAATGAVATAQEDLPGLVRGAGERFEPIGDEQLSAARGELLARMDELERFLRPGTANSEKWLRYLRWSELREQLAEERQPDPAALDATLQRLNRNETGLEMAPFRRITDALRRYSDLVNAASAANQEEVYRRQLDALAAEVERYERDPSANLDWAIGGRLGYVAALGQAPELVAELRRRFNRPNGFVNVSANLLTAAAEPIDRVEPVTDCILGVNIRSTAHTVGSVQVRPVPSEQVARLDLVSTGHVDSQSVGYKSPAVIHSTSRTAFTATKRVELADEAFRGLSAHVNARTNSQIHSVAKQGGGFGSRLVSNIGWQRAQESKGQASTIAARHAEQRIARRMNDEVRGKIDDAWNQYQDEYRRPLARQGEVPEQIRFYTTESDLAVEVTQANRAQLAAPDAPPALPGGHDLVMRLHQTAVNNYASIVLSGATVTETSPDEEAQFDVELPEWMQRIWERRKVDSDTEPVASADLPAPQAGRSDAVPPEGGPVLVSPDEADGPADLADANSVASNTSDRPFKPSALTFRRGRPISVAFVDGRVHLTIHVSRLVSGDERFERWDIAGVFVPELEDGVLVLHRDGDLEVLPTGFDRERGRLSSRDVGIRSNLTRVLNERSAEGRGFPSRIEFPPLEPGGNLASVGPLAMGVFDSGNGWLVSAWDRQGRGAGPRPPAPGRVAMQSGNR